MFLEQSVTNRDPSYSILFITFRCHVGLISIDQKLMDGSGDTRINVLNSEFKLLRDQTEGTGRVTDVQLSESTKIRLLALAEAIGRQFEAVRVDTVLGDDNEVYLNEITFSNDAGLPLF